MENKLTAAFDANVQDVFTHAGQTVRKGQRLAVLEAMKMEMDVTAPADGVVTEWNLEKGSQIHKGDVMGVIGK